MLKFEPVSMFETAHQPAVMVVVIYTGASVLVGNCDWTMDALRRWRLANPTEAVVNQLRPHVASQ